MPENTKRNELKGKDKFLSSLSSFLEKNRIILLVILAVIAAAIIVVAVIDSVKTKRANEAASRVESVQTVYEQWTTTEKDDPMKTTLESGMIEDIDRIIAEYPDTYASQRAFFIKANVYFQKEEWETAADYFIDSSNVNRDSYLSPVALAMAASSFENASDFQRALELYRDISDNYADSYPEIPRVVLSIGRLCEQTGDNAGAVEAYNRLLDNYPESGWASFARTRLIQTGN